MTKLPVGSFPPLSRGLLERNGQGTVPQTQALH